MGNSARFGLTMIGLFVGGIACALALWYVSSGDTTSVLAAMVEQTPTPARASTPTPPVPRKAVYPPRPGQRGPLWGLRARGLPFRLGSLGTVRAMNGNELSIQPRTPARDFTLDAGTRIIVAGKPGATKDNIQPGDQVLVMGGLNQNRAPRAILAVPPSYTIENVAVGRIASVDGPRVVLLTRSGEVQVTLEDAAQLFGDGLRTMTVGDLRVGRAVVVIGTRKSDGTMAGQVVFMPPARQGN